MTSNTEKLAIADGPSWSHFVCIEASKGGSKAGSLKGCLGCREGQPWFRATKPGIVWSLRLEKYQQLQASNRKEEGRE